MKKFGATSLVILVGVLSLGTSYAADRCDGFSKYAVNDPIAGEGDIPTKTSLGAYFLGKVTAVGNYSMSVSGDLPNSGISISANINCMPGKDGALTGSLTYNNSSSSLGIGENANGNKSAIHEDGSIYVVTTDLIPVALSFSKV
jgi:hypothetical protein